MRRILYVFLVTVCLIAPTGAQEQEQIADLSAKATRVSRAGNNGPLTGPSSAQRAEIVSAFLRGRHDEATASSLVVENENPTERGPIHVRLRQQVAGLEIYGTYARATLTPAGEILSVVENLAPVSGTLLPAQIEYRDALGAVIEQRYPGVPGDLPEVASANNKVTFGRGTRFYEEPTVTRVAVPLSGGRLRVGYLVETWDHENQLWHTVVNGNGRILFEELRTASDTYKIYPNAPDKTAQTVVSGPGASSTDSPEGWLVSNTSTTTTGNNVDAYLDRNNDNSPDTNGRPVSATRDFVTTADLTQSPTTTTNQMVAVTNLFYLNNVLHDKLRRHGFTEAAGNFQTNNFGLGGFGNDSVRAEAQDGGGTNNANFATPSDGSRPRMQMYLWTTATPNRDGDLDSDIVYHEYGHGLTWRMIGGMSGKLAGAIGEGMSDTVAFYMNGDDAVAEYSYNRAQGIRRFKYTDYPNTYSDVLGQSVHNDGEIYGATMWKLRQLWLDSGRSHDQLWNYVIDGMNYTPSTPAYEDMRDGILAAMPTQAEDCIVWQAFAQFGIGEGADGQVFPNFRITESFVVPSSCTTPPPNTAPTVSITAPADGSSFQQGTSVTFTGTASDAEQGSLTASMVWTSTLQGNLGTGGSFSRSDLIVGTHTVTASVTDTGGLSGTASRTLTVTSAPPPSTITLTTRGYKVKGVRRVDLTWTGAAGSNVTIFLGASPVATTANDGAYTHVLPGRGGGSFTFTVCEVAPSTKCSNVSTVVF
jgi:hypothetical protein